MALVASDTVAAGRPAPFLISRAKELAGVTSVDRVLAVRCDAMQISLSSGRQLGGPTRCALAHALLHWLDDPVDRYSVRVRDDLKQHESYTTSN